MNDLIIQFSILELGAFLGLIQSVYVLVSIALRSNNLKRAVFPVLFFLNISTAFFAIIAQKYWHMPYDTYGQVSLFLWTMCAPLSAFLIIQVARITSPPPLIYSPVLFVVPWIFGGLIMFGRIYEAINLDWLYIVSIIIGAFSLLMIWFKREALDQLHKRKNGKERYWLIIAMIILNLTLISANFVYFNSAPDSQSHELIRVLIGISFLYVTATSLFRVYPPVLSLSSDQKRSKSELSPEETDISLAIEDLLHVQKVYQEPSYGRSEMAKELNVNESQLSRIVNVYFQQTVPVLLNSLRVEEAKSLLIQTKADISTISEESGFNSIATFNRVFKSVVGVSPSEYRAKKK